MSYADDLKLLLEFFNTEHGRHYGLALLNVIEGHRVALRNKLSVASISELELRLANGRMLALDQLFNEISNEST